MPRYRHCDDELPDDCPADVTSYRSYCNWRSRHMGDMLTPDEADALTLFWGLCALDVAIRDGLVLMPELD